MASEYKPKWFAVGVSMALLGCWLVFWQPGPFGESPAFALGPLLLARQRTVCRRLQQPLKGRALRMAFGRAGGGVAQTIAHGLEALDHGIQLVGLGREQLPVDVGLATGQEHGADLVQREPRRLPQRNQSQLVQHAGRKPAALAGLPHRLDQALLLVIPQRGRPQTGAFGDFGNVHEKTS